MSKLINLTGQKFGKLVPLLFENGKWVCDCDCGKRLSVPGYCLISGNTKSCGCLKTENLIARAYKLAEGKREFEPCVASARRVWKNTYEYRDDDCVDFETFLELSQQNCFYCGIEPNTKYNYFLTKSSRSSEKAQKEGLFIYNGIDRLDNSKPHTKNNVVSCCESCNRAKNDRTVAEFLRWISRLHTKNFESINITNIDFPGSPLSSSIKCIFYGYKKDTDITIKEFYSISQMPCFYCNSSPNNFYDRGKSDKKASEKTKKAGSFYYNGLDKIDRFQPHNKNNIVPCCYYCNFAKNKLSLSEFQSWIKRVQLYQKCKPLI